MYARKTAGEETTLDVENLQHIVTEILAAGTETTTSTLRWVLLFMATNPDVQEKCYQDVQTHYRLPYNSIIITNLDSVLMDEKIWGDPKVFRPERFISEDGKLIPREELIHFSIGKRKCMGETTAKIEVFLFFTHLIQRFRFITEPGKPAPGFEAAFGATNAPKAFKICAIPR
ncbi:cytochrome P450 2D28 [Patella vulgata]|uniref:cytochrome P450 2D28 n=1 Tax=Patella vulgata TaxID=6465 RepID=UPI0024A93CFB|nr:cytochrome P450 2D28 [Patella vulgata]